MQIGMKFSCCNLVAYIFRNVGTAQIRFVVGRLSLISKMGRRLGWRRTEWKNQYPIAQF